MHPWRDRLTRWFSPLARRSPLSPNAITILALLLNAAAAALLVRRWFVMAIILIAFAGLADAFDGIVARTQGKETRFGDFLDHFADRVSDTLLTAGWAVGSGVRESLVLAAVIVTMLNGYVGTQIEATFRERNYESIGRGEFVLALIVLPLVSYILFRSGWDSIRAGGLTIAEWLAAALIAFAILAIGQRLALARRLERS
jgi:archaetidylinositol phosphate synthase